ncbi:MAG: stage II sporulation protein D [Firmicutes bacterium]|nr:stage II sporulation protein D [Bacillota bacterium]
MKVFRKKRTTFTAAAVAAVVFCLHLIPLILVLLFGDFGGGDRAEPEGEKIPVSVEISLWRDQTEEVVTLDLEDYAAGVVAGEMPGTFAPEALKAQAVAARTYALARMQKAEVSGNPGEHPAAPLCDTTHCQVYRSPEELADLKGKAWMKKEWVCILAAAEDTAGQVMTYQGNLVEQPLFHSSSGGKTENSEDVFVSAVPYLRSVSSDYEGEAPYQKEDAAFPLEEFRSKIKKAFGDPGGISEGNVRVLEHSEGGRVSRIQVGSLTLTGRQVRETLGLRSADFTVSFEDGTIIFTTKGYGHGVGMSQWGANGMAQAGYDYRAILQHYYSGVEVR